MLHYRYDKDHSIISLIPDGPLTQEDFERIAEKVDPIIEEQGGLNGVLIEAEKAPGWADFQSMVSHLTFLKDHHKTIRKVAVVTDSQLMSQAPSIAKHFVEAEVKSFDLGSKKEAKSWILSPRQAALVPIAFDGPVVGLKVVGKIEKQDLKELEPAIDAKLETYPKIGIYVEMDKFYGISLAALVEDMKYAFPKWRRFAKKAVVTDKKWVKELYKVAKDWTGGIKVKQFDSDEQQKARKWVADID